MASENQFLLFGDPAEVDAVVTTGDDWYVLAHNDAESTAVPYRRGAAAREVASEHDVPVYELDELDGIN